MFAIWVQVVFRRQTKRHPAGIVNGIGVEQAVRSGGVELASRRRCSVLTVAPTGHKGANTPWKRVRLTRDWGTSAAQRVMKSNGQFRTTSSEATFLLADGVAPDAKVVASG